ncbi:hypothetical protein CALVIDRAFT_378680 [Calocera viscosa TUFC12733]|uniref:Uncharacterized protein n=1 Tax=Calocera viscosa (strain TUFC12733) TaxID=1330018 RepID=A0A167Q2N2_CALVF|nr:hypothetical protein CALVIDRAFT_378680 [Calocera viscosa TUFC12733]
MQDQTDAALQKTVLSWCIVVVVVSLAQSVSATGLLAFRIWKIDRASSMLKDRSLRPVARILVESGFLYTSFMIAVLVVLVMDCPPLNFFNQLRSPVTAIAFYMIIVRAGSHKNAASGASSQARTQRTVSMASHARGISVQHEITIQHEEQDQEASSIGEADSLRMKELGQSSSSYLDA